MAVGNGKCAWLRRPDETSHQGKVAPPPNPRGEVVMGPFAQGS